MLNLNNTGCWTTITSSGFLRLLRSRCRGAFLFSGSGWIRDRMVQTAADLSKYFDTIPHDQLLRSVAARIVDRHVLRLIEAWLKAPVEAMDPDGRRHMSGGKQTTCGTPQGGVISPLLANRYMNRFLRHWRNQGRGEANRAQVVNYADDFVILSRGYAEEALAWTRQVMTRLGLTVNETEDRFAKCEAGTLRLPGVHLRAALLPEGTVTGILGPVRRGRACKPQDACGGRSWSRPMSLLGMKCAPG
jgi:reverse transcriptase-like protein